jgi:hypothetical protein
MNRIWKELSEALLEILSQNMLGGTEDNYVNCFEPRFKPRISVISIGQVTICSYKHIKRMRKLLKFVFYFYLPSYLSVVQWSSITSFQSPNLPVYHTVVQNNSGNFEDSYFVTLKISRKMTVLMEAV